MDKQIRDIIGKGDDEAPVLDKVIKDIFMSCDTENEEFVPVSKLVDFIMPFLQGNIHALDELQKSLDPNNANPSIDIDTFYKDMNEWTLKISSADHADEEDVHNITPRDFERISDKEFSFLQSTPRSSFGHHLLKGYVESGISNLSIASSTNENQSHYFSDRTVLEDQVRELQHQKRQINEELVRVKFELTSTSEQYESLQLDYEKALKKLTNEQKLNAQLQPERKKEDDCEEELCCARKQVVKLERSVANLEKQNSQLQQELDGVVMEKQALEYQIQRMDRKSDEIKSNMVILQTEIDIRKSEVVSEQKTNEALTQHIQALLDIIEKSIINIDRLKLEKTMLRKFYRDKMNKGESLQGIDLSRSLRSNSLSEYAEVSRKIAERRRLSDVTAKFVPAVRTKSFNSPKLLRMLREPVTPGLDPPKAALKTSSNHEDAVSYRNEVNLATMILNKANTPYLNKQDRRPLLDITPPAELNAIRLLTPIVSRLPSTNCSIGAEMLELIIEGALEKVNHACDTPDSMCNQSPPVMYVVERTPDNNTSCEISNHTQYSPKVNDSSDEFFFYNYEIMTSGENLLEEMAKASVCGIDEESECEESISDGMGKGDTISDSNQKTFVTEAHLKLDDYMDLEQKCEALEQKIEELESENSTKDLKIFDLNSQIEKLREKLSMEEDVRIEDLLSRIDELEREKRSYQVEKGKLIEEMKVLKEEKANLQSSKEKLLLKVVELERKLPDDKESLPVERLSSKFIRETFVLDKSNAKLENLDFAKRDFECLKLDYERVKSTMETYQKINENLTSKNKFLQKAIREKERLLEENLDEIVQIREVSESLKDKIHDLNMQLEDSKRFGIHVENELNRRETDMQRIREKLTKNERSIEDLNRTLKSSESEKERLQELIEESRIELGEKSELLERLNKKEEMKSEMKQILDETRRKLEQETKKQDYLCKKYLNLENELIEEKNNSGIFKERCNNLQGDILKFRETMSRLEEQTIQMQDQNEQLTLQNATLNKEILSLIEAKNFLAKRNEELLQENAEVYHKYDILTKEFDGKIAIVEEASRKLREIEYLRSENVRIKTANAEIFQKLRTADSEKAESDQVDAYRRETGGFRRGKGKQAAGRLNFDRMSLRNNKLEERNANLTEQVAELKEKLCKEVEAKNSIIAHTNTVKDILYERRIRLRRATESTADLWRSTLENFINKDLFGDELEPESPTLALTESLDNEMWQLKHQIHLTTVLLSHLTCFMNRQMLKKNQYTQTETDYSVALHKVGEISTTRMEETFATLVLTYTVDKDLLDQRFHTKKIQLGEMERSLGEAVSALTLHLEENARGLDVSDFMSNIFHLCTQISISAVQYGSLRQQTELTAAAEMMVNYVANLKQEIELLSQPAAILPTTSLTDPIEFHHQEDTSANLDVHQKQKQSRRFLSCAKTTCIIFTFSVFVLVASLVLHTDAVFNIHRCTPPI